MNKKKRSFFRKRLMVSAVILMAMFMLNGCLFKQVDTVKDALVSELKERLESVIEGKEQLAAWIDDPGKQEENTPDGEIIDETGANPEARRNEAAVLEGYDEIVEAMDSVMAEYIDEDAEDESVTMEEAAQMAEVSDGGFFVCGACHAAQDGGVLARLS